MFYRRGQDNYFESLPQREIALCTEVTILVLMHKERVYTFFDIFADNVTFKDISMYCCYKERFFNIFLTRLWLFGEETIQCPLSFVFKHCVGNCITFSQADPSTVLNSLTTMQLKQEF